MQQTITVAREQPVAKIRIGFCFVGRIGSLQGEFEMPEVERDEGKLQQHEVKLVLRPGDRSYAVDVAEEEGVAKSQNALGAGAERQAVGRNFLQIGEAHEMEPVMEGEVEDGGKQRLAFVHRMEFDFGRQGDAVIVEGLRSSFEDVEFRALRIE